ncbi:hypothetical protein OSB04_031596 [Centaurea solstitialis]|uniref:Uncharacterized protein n=1 Tax=Centaurea solstitialis TaxID=347529 RepID=A0AA38SHB7_9ASTR|nr:hypothetical protein OSB04_031596 [Centaurea solstitialis]
MDSLHTVYLEPKTHIMPSVEVLLRSGEVQCRRGGGNPKAYWEQATRGRLCRAAVQAQADMLEIVPPATSKDNGVKKLLDHFGASTDEVCVARSNGSEKTKVVANVIGASNDDDGVADAIYKYAFY